MKRIILGVLLGIVAGLVDVLGMVFMGLSWSANFSAFFHWVIVGFFVGAVDLDVSGWFKGLIVSVLMLVPIGFLVWWQDASSVVPMTVASVVFGVVLGALVDAYGE